MTSKDVIRNEIQNSFNFYEQYQLQTINNVQYLIRNDGQNKKIELIKKNFFQIYLKEEFQRWIKINLIRF